MKQAVQSKAKQVKSKTQLQKAADKLKTLAIDVTSKDRKAAEEKFGYNRMTIGNYLKGDAKDLDIAMDLIAFFEERIAAREKHLSKAAA